MFPYRVKYTESEHDIQNNNLLYEIHQQCQNAFDILEIFKNNNKSNLYLIIDISYIINIPRFFVTFYIFCIFCFNMAVSGFLCVQGGPSQKSLHLAVIWGHTLGSWIISIRRFSSVQLRHSSHRWCFATAAAAALAQPSWRRLRLRSPGCLRSGSIVVNWIVEFN